MNNLIETQQQSSAQPESTLNRAKRLLLDESPDPWDLLEVTEEIIGDSPLIPNETTSQIMSFRNNGEMEILFALSEKMQDVASSVDDTDLEKTLLAQVDQIDNVLKVVSDAIAISRKQFRGTIPASNNSFNDEADRFRT